MAKRLEKMTLNDAINLYMEEYQEELEAKRIDMETDKCYAEYAAQVAQRVAEEMDLAWDQHLWDEFYAVACEDYDTEECIRQFFESEDSQDMVDEAVDSGPQKDMKAAKRRKQNARHKKRVRRNAINAAKNNAKRGEDDQMSESCRGGYVIKNPKSLTQKTDKIWKQAEKMKLVDDNTPID